MQLQEVGVTANKRRRVQACGFRRRKCCLLPRGCRSIDLDDRHRCLLNLWERGRRCPPSFWTVRGRSRTMMAEVERVVRGSTSDPKDHSRASNALKAGFLAASFISTTTRLPRNRHAMSREAIDLPGVTRHTYRGKVKRQASNVGRRWLSSPTCRHARAHQSG